MATSPIYSWPEPDNTDLVKNGALAIRTLGNAIDTTMGTMVAKTVVDAKGDLIAGTAADTVNRLAVGNNGETLVADSSTSTGLRYQGNFAAGKNKIINGDFGIWQRGTSFNTTGLFFGPDRFKTFSYSGSSATISQQTFTPGTAPVAGYEGQYFCRISSTNTQNLLLQNIEDVRTFAGQTITVSFWAKSASATSVSIGFEQNFGSGGSTSVFAAMGSASVTTSWARYSVTYAIPSISGKTVGTSSYLQIYFASTTLNNNLDFWGLQAEVGSTATAFQTATGTIQGELTACQRYYQRWNAGGSYGFPAPNYTPASTTSIVYLNFAPFVPLRIGSGSSLEYAGSISLSDTQSRYSGGTWVNSTSSTQSITITYTHGSAALTQYRSYTIQANNDSTVYFAISAEL